jgi:large subunit ribosomal protein L35
MERRIPMPKIKTHRGAAKRFKFTGTGKIMRSKAYKSHLLTGKNRKRKRNLRKKTLVDSTSVQAIRRVLPYGS